MVNEFQKKAIEFHTYKPKEERSFRVVLKNMHPSTDTTDFKAAIEELRHQVTNIWNIKSKLTKKPLSIFFIDLKLSSENEQIYN